MIARTGEINDLFNKKGGKQNEHHYDEGWYTDLLQGLGYRTTCGV
jgi:hypothetical protein